MTYASVETNWSRLKDRPSVFCTIYRTLGKESQSFWSPRTYINTGTGQLQVVVSCDQQGAWWFQSSIRTWSSSVNLMGRDAILIKLLRWWRAVGKACSQLWDEGCKGADTYWSCVFMVQLSEQKRVRMEVRVRDEASASRIARRVRWGGNFINVVVMRVLREVDFWQLASRATLGYVLGYSLYVITWLFRLSHKAHSKCNANKFPFYFEMLHQ